MTKIQTSPVFAVKIMLQRWNILSRGHKTSKTEAFDIFAEI